MRSTGIRNWCFGLPFAVWMAVVFLPVSVPAVTIQEFLTPTANSSPAAVAFDSKGNLWFTEIHANNIGKLDPSQAQPGTSKGITEYNLPQKNSKPMYIMVARDDGVWFSQIGGNRIGRLDPKSGAIREYPVPTPNSEPHKLVEARDGSIWFTQFETDKLARLDPVSGKIEEFDVNPGHPHGLVLREGRLWYTQGGKFWMKIFFNKVGSYEIASGRIKEMTIPPRKSVPHGLTRAGDGTLWFTQFFTNKIARIDASSNPPKITEYIVPGESRRGTHSLVVDDTRQRVWFTLNHAGSIGRLDLNRARAGTDQGMEVYKIPTQGSHPHELVVDKEGNVWFAEMGMYFRGKYQNKIGKLIP